MTAKDEVNPGDSRVPSDGSGPRGADVSEEDGHLHVSSVHIAPMGTYLVGEAHLARTWTPQKVGRSLSTSSWGPTHMHTVAQKGQVDAPGEPKICFS